MSGKKEGPTFGSIVAASVLAMFGAAIVYSMLSEMIAKSPHPAGTLFAMLLPLVLIAAVWLISIGKIEVKTGGGGHGGEHVD